MRAYNPNRIHSFKCESHIGKEIKITRNYTKGKKFAREIVYAERTDKNDIVIIPDNIIENLKDNSPYGFTGELKEGYYYMGDIMIRLYDIHSVYNGEAYARVEYNINEKDEAFANFVDMSEDKLEYARDKGELDGGMYKICKKFQELGVFSTFCCNGHGKKKAYIQFSTKTDENYLRKLLKDEDYITIETCKHSGGNIYYTRIYFEFTAENVAKIMKLNKITDNSIEEKTKKAIEIQNELQKSIQIKNIGINSIKTVAGVDSAYWIEEDGTENAVCSIVVIDVDTLEVIEKQHEIGEITFPYIAGCLAFRELDLILKTVTKLESNIDTFVFDGNGILHERKMGLATHAGIILDKPTIGIAKKLYNIDGLQVTTPDNNDNSYTYLTKDSETLGVCLRTHKDIKPVYVSVGSNMCLDTAIQLAIKLTTKDSRIPIPTRLADIETHILRKEYKDK